MNHIFEGNQIFVGQEWIIYLHQLPMIRYYEMDKSKVTGGGQRQYELQYYNYRDVNYNDTVHWKIDLFLKQSKRNTRKASIKTNKRVWQLYL